jgi:hypothetical protein
MISLHILADNAAPERLERAVQYLRRVRPKYVNIAGGSQLDIAMQLTERVRLEVPGIKVVFRHMRPEDTGIHTKMSASTLYNMKVAPHLAWFKKHEVIFMPDNESSGDDNQMRRYAQWQIEMAVLLHNDNLRGAFCRFATGNIGDGSHGSNQYPLLKDIFTAMLPGDMISPNEYSNAPGRSSAGHLKRYKQMWKAAGRPLETTIGEAGIAVNYDPGNGYRSIGLPGSKYAQEMIDQEIWYDGGKIDRFLYCIGGYGWESFQIGDDVLEHLEKYYASNSPPVEIPMPTPPPFVIVPADKGKGEPFTIVTGCVLQANASSDTNCLVGNLTPGERVTVYRKPREDADGLTWHYYERTSTPVGESPNGWASHRLPVPDPVIVPPPTSTAEAALKHIAALWLERKQVTARRAEIDEELSALLSIWSDAA